MVENSRTNLKTTVLMVGAGGIGCELLKNLLLTQYGCIHVVDLDTITLSNLNRQFLFRQKDIDKSKSLTVVKAVESFNYFNTELVAHHGNIMDQEQFPLSWWQQFSFIFNALDNLEARRYVNKMCLLLKKPLMESGSTGYDGQVQPIIPFASECFDCQPKPIPKSFPVCTIRSTPSQPVHCITWAKEFLFCQLFDESTSTISGEQGFEEQKSALEKETDDKKEIENMLKETNELHDLRRLVKALEPGKYDAFAFEVINKIFKVDIERLLRIDSLWKNRVHPRPLEFKEYYEDKIRSMLKEPANEELLKKDTKVWDPAENIYVLIVSIRKLQARLKKIESFISFDKDDEDTLNFVAAAANLRSHIFSIELKSKFDIKQIAGNIIPAIATTNAIISGLSCLESLYFLGGEDYRNTVSSIGQPSSVFISIRPNKYITSAPLVEPRENCPSCSSARGIFNVTYEDFSQWTLGDFVKQVIHKYGYPSEISIISGKSRLLYDPDFDDNLNVKMRDLNGFENGSTLLIQDEDEELENLELHVLNTADTTALPEIKLKPRARTHDREDKDYEGKENTDHVIEGDADWDLSSVEEVEDIVEKPKKRRISESFESSEKTKRIDLE